MSQCPSCGYRIPAAVLAGGGSAHCPRCGDPLATQHAATVSVEAQPEVAPGSTLAPGSLTAAHDSSRPVPSAKLPSIPGYELLEVIGRGGMGIVYKARQLSPRRIVALKMILSGGGRADRFRSEVAAVARLQHPNVVQIHEVGEIDGRSYFSMEYVPGGSLAKHLRDGQLPTRDAAQIVMTLARAVQHAHDRGIVHRDLKPANILLSSECGIRNAESKTAETPTADSSTPSSEFRIPNWKNSALQLKIADFGLAKHLEGSTDSGGPQTQSGAILGTPNYMAPEQAKGKTKTIGPAVDVWALGAILYECLTGRPPFREESQLDTLMKVISEDAPPPRQLRSAVPRDLEVICLKCLRKEPKERYATASALGDDLERFLDGRPIAARARTTRERVTGWARRRREYLALVAGAALVIGVALAVFSLWPRNRPAPPEPTPEVTSNLPPDLRFVPPNSLAFATVRVSDLWNNPAARELVDHQANLGNKRDTLDSLAREIEDETTIHPKHIERVTFVMPEETVDRKVLIILLTTGPYSHDRLRDALTNRGKHLPQSAGERTVYISNGQRDLAFLPFSDRILILGDSETVWKAANNPNPGVGLLTPVLERAAGTHALVAGFRPSRPLAEQFLKDFRLGPEVGPVASLRTIGITVDASHPTGPIGRVTIDVGGEVTYPTAEEAEAAHPHLPKVVRALIEAFFGNQEGRFLAQALDPLLAPVKSAAWLREGDTLRAIVQGHVDVSTIKAQMNEVVQREKSAANMRRIASAMQQYHNKYGRFPPAVVTDADGKPLYSWRVLILPYLGGDAANVYRRFHLNRAWDHPSNRPLLDQMPAVFASPGVKPGGNATLYQVLTGEGGLFDSPEGRRLEEITDGTVGTILFIEAADAVPWTKPVDLPFELGRVPKLGGSSWSYVAMAEGTVHFIPHQSLTPARLRGLFTRAGGEVEPPP
ncbi:MAG: protein kinase [Planctomycetia bacterium]|nr:protein kinase [Planctomycetia bacterium]